MRMRGNAVVLAMQLERPTRTAAEVRIVRERETVERGKEGEEGGREEGSSMPRKL